MYEIINQCYGIRIQDAEQPIPTKEAIEFIRDLIKLKDSKIIDIDEWEDEVIIEWWEEVGSEEKYGIRHYDGSGAAAPRHIGFDIDDWPSWELNGESGFMKAMINSKETKEMIVKWNTLVPEKVRNLLNKHNLKPTIFWTTSTS